jgi:chromate transporter
LSAVTAAVVGVILNLAVWFARQVMFPATGGVDGFVVLVSAIAFAGIWKWKWDMIPVVLGAGLLGLARALLLGGL